VRALALPLERFPGAFRTDENEAGTGHSSVGKYVSLKIERCASRPNWLGCAPAKPFDGFVNAGSDLSRGNASVCGRKSGWGGGRCLGLLVIDSTQFVAAGRSLLGVRACARVIRLTVRSVPDRMGPG
jgi:hypothetical protein